MTTKLTVAPCKWENGSVKGRCKRKKGKGKGVFPFPFSGSKQTSEVGNEFPHFHISPLPPQTKHVQVSFGDAMIKLLGLIVKK